MLKIHHLRLCFSVHLVERAFRHGNRRSDNNLLFYICHSRAENSVTTSVYYLNFITEIEVMYAKSSIRSTWPTYFHSRKYHKWLSHRFYVNVTFLTSVKNVPKMKDISVFPRPFCKVRVFITRQQNLEQVFA